jgi:hypothetical protein
MRRPLSVLLLCAGVMLGGELMAQGQADSTQGAHIGAASTGTAAPSAASPQTTLRMRGTITGYDAATGILSLATTRGSAQFPVASTVPVQRAGHKVDALELKQLSGYRAAVRYSESGGRRTVESVNVFEKGERIER